MARVRIMEGDLLDQDVEVIVNAWNRNIIPWWLLIPQGVSRAIRRRAGTEPFKELRRHGSIPLGGAVRTGAGELPHKAIVHVAGISMWWRASEESIRLSVQSAMESVKGHGDESVAFPLIGAGTGGIGEREAEALMLEELSQIEYSGEVRLVRYRENGRLKAESCYRRRHEALARAQSFHEVAGAPRR